MGCLEVELPDIFAPAFYLWKEWPKDMLVTPLGGNPNENKFSLSGTCPHCDRQSVFLIVAGVYGEAINPNNIRMWRIAAGMQCQGCKKLILGIVIKDGNNNFTYEIHYPLGKPKDDVSSEVPANIAADFKEAMRCRWVDAHNATVEMCRRAIQAACIHLEAPAGKALVNQIDFLASKGKITEPLQKMAHRIRLGGNLGAHPPEDPNDPDEITISAEYADAVIEFTRDFFQHVYVMPKRLERYTFKK